MVLSVISTAAVVIGVAFAGFELRMSRRQRAREAELLLARSYQTPEFMRALDLVVDLPDALTKSKLEALSDADQQSIGYWLGAMESIGVLVHNDELSIDRVEDFMSGPIVVSWEKLAPYVKARRRTLQRETMHEWFQWLAERIASREQAEQPVPANVEFAEPDG